ncbi:MAG: hypothetical protein WAR77_09515 [Saprospiraceae bacterium]
MDLDNLSKIQRVEVPPVLLSKILHKIEQTKKERIPKNISFAMSIIFILILVFNAVILINYHSNANTTESFATSINLISNNSLY